MLQQTPLLAQFRCVTPVLQVLLHYPQLLCRPLQKQIIRTDACLPAGSNRLEFYGRYDDCFARLPVPKAPPPVTGVANEG